MSVLIKTPSTQARFSRRAFLRGAGASAATVPLLFAEPVRGQGTTLDGAPRRFVSVAWGNGIVRPEFYPAGDELVLGQVLQPLEPWKSKVLMPAGLDMKCLMDAGHRYAGHFSYGALLTGTYAKGWKSAGKSIDTVIAEELRNKGVNRPALQLNLGIAPDGEGTSWRESGVRNTSETDPARLYQTLFAGRNLSAPDLSKLRARRKSVLDFLTGELGVFSARLGTEDRMKIEAHTGSIRDIERQLDSGGGGGAACMSPAAPAGPFNMASRSAAQFGLLTVALRCDLTRAATMDVYDVHGKFGVSHSFIGVSGDYHPLAHQGGKGYAQKVKIDRWIYEQIAILVKGLADTPEVGGSALDNTVIMTGNGMCEGADHGVQGIPWLLIGSCGGYFKTGRVVKFGTWIGKTGNYYTAPSGVPHNKLLATIGNAMGVPMTGFGPPQYDGVLPELKA
jgi:Protein of unknown function (DUF1552)